MKKPPVPRVGGQVVTRRPSTFRQKSPPQLRQTDYGLHGAVLGGISALGAGAYFASKAKLSTPITLMAAAAAGILGVGGGQMVAYALQYPHEAKAITGRTVGWIVQTPSRLLNKAPRTTR